MNEEDLGVYIAIKSSQVTNDTINWLEPILFNETPDKTLSQLNVSLATSLKACTYEDDVVRYLSHSFEKDPPKEFENGFNSLKKGGQFLCLPKSSSFNVSHSAHSLHLMVRKKDFTTCRNILASNATDSTGHPTPTTARAAFKGTSHGYMFNSYSTTDQIIVQRSMLLLDQALGNTVGDDTNTYNF